MDHLRIYWALASSVPKGSNRCKMGQRLVSKLTNLSQPTVNRRIKDLVDWGHINVEPGAPGKRSSYVLTSMAFQIKQKPQRAATAPSKRGETWKARMWAEASAEREKESA
jgi:hypothetical protein